MEKNFYSVSEYLYRLLNYNESHGTDLKDMTGTIQPAVIAEAPERRDAAYDEKVMEFYGRYNKKILKAYHNETQAEFARQVEELYQEYQGELDAYEASKEEPQDGADIPEEGEDGGEV